MQVVNLKVNGQSYRVEIEPRRTLLQVLREELELTGTKRGCDNGSCGTCTVLLDGEPILSCLKLAVDCQGKDILTIEGLAMNDNLHPIQEAFIKHGGLQCGFCTPGMILTAKSLLDKNPTPTEMEARKAISGNLCRCSGYVKIVEAILAASQKQ